MATQGFAIPALREGRMVYDDGEGAVSWAVFARRDVQRFLESDPAEGNEGIAEAITGWAEFYRGPGRPFGCAPTMRAFGRKVLITWRTGLDV